jgi:anti-sigma regulatory factor (Ser/Thr protein kinase)
MSSLRISNRGRLPRPACSAMRTASVRSWLNLLSNAIKFTAPGGRIGVRARHVPDAAAAGHLPRRGPWIAIEVEDNGPGIPPEQYPRIFEPFVQVEEGHTRSAGGTGLGLSISRRLARMMDGELTVESAVGNGSRFTLWLVPASGAVPAAAETDGAAARLMRLAARQGVDGQLAALESIGQLLLAATEQLEDELVSRMRSDPLIEEAEAVSDSQLADHAAAYLASLAKALIAIGTSDGHLLTDSEEIQKVIAKRHGRQRRRLGWTRAALRREFGLLHDVLDSFLRRAVLRDTDGDPAELLGVLHRLLATGEEQSVGEFDRAGDKA